MCKMHASFCFSRPASHHPKALLLQFFGFYLNKTVQTTAHLFGSSTTALLACEMIYTLL